MSVVIRRRFVTVGNRQVHYLRAGSGPVVVLEHPSPVSAHIFVPLIERLADHYTVFALDRPGAGNSDPLDIETPEISDFAEALKLTLDALDIGSMVLYGMSTGAMVSLEFSIRNSSQVDALILENLPVATVEEQGEQLDQYSPAALIVPEWDGAHLLRLWNFSRGIWTFWPWFRREVPTRRDIDLPPVEGIQEVLFGSTLPGPKSGLIYDAVWRFSTQVIPRVRMLEELGVPTTLMGREDDVCYGTLDRLPPLGESFLIERLPREPRAKQWPAGWFWSGELEAIVRRHVAKGGAPPETEAAPIPGEVTRSYVDYGDRQVLIRRIEGGSRRPLVMLHPCPGSGRSVEPLMRALAPVCPVLAVDLPGLGDSDPLPTNAPTVGDYAEAVADAVGVLGLAEVDLYGRGAGALIALELGILHPELVRSVILDSMPLWTAEERVELLEHTADFEPRIDGAHVVSAWNSVRDATLWWPPHNRTREGILWVDPPAPDAIHADVMDLLRSKDYTSAVRATLAYPVREKLPMIQTKVMLCNREDDVADRYWEETSRLVPSAHAHTLSDSLDETARLIDYFLESSAVVSR